MEEVNKQQVESTAAQPLGKESVEASAGSEGQAVNSEETGEQSGKKKTKGKALSAAKQITEENAMLVKVGKTAIKEHKLPEVFVTSDGIPFRQLSDARNHAMNLQSAQIVTVKSE
ncbi:hypothetical protein Prede_2584 [Prevotella dentalis DSM 3688]|uniref:Uncharacterized protein n=1 Tax=Prevotella dentalis (strain ATCC 49559 / DSM 3688 / JCM 13448 / NCTC 12043 / ES 2772) TaxID=908937 RepID=F9D787_PREDD|nr:hypothetical protein [Prevotella dentalis]AGB29750.1 hypothetical protein Prede_2505 [Prevotella dentalis DSM 3688]AGB29819.1 hypothetical protein Prede_2584 [Prevotella dentalis DSM 3688]EGQ11453.1 hypothetical protein HMPREF9136_2715 [Prevotella dentalis DSM 3688]